MMGQGSYWVPAGGYPVVAVVGHHLMAPYPVDLTIVRKMLTISECYTFGVRDANGNIMFMVKRKFARCILLDATGKPIVSFQKKIMSMRSTWKVYKGDSGDSTRDLLFTVRKSSLFQFKTQLDVFLKFNTSKVHRDFRIKGGWFEKSCTNIYDRNSNVIAQMHRKHSVSSIVLGEDNFAVTVYPNVEFAFIVALVVILEEID